ncbi:MAG: AEC family transporter [Raoultibacter sp.]
MVDLSGALSQMLMLLLIACAGYVAAKLKFLDDYTKDKLTKLLLNITLPCMIIASVGNLDSQAAQGQIPWAFALSAAQFFLLLACGALCNSILRTPVEERRLYLFMSVCTNTGFIGIPVITAIYGDQTVVLSSIFVMVISIFVYSVGFGLIAKPKGGKAKIPWRSMVNPSVVACIIAISLFLLGIKVHPLLEGTLSMLGGITSPIAMLIVGVIMAGVSFKSVLTEVRLYPFIVIRQLLAPLVLFFLLRTVVPDATLLGVFVVMFAMPVGSMASTFASQLGQEPTLAAKGTVLSTAASFVIIPILVAAMTLV